MQNPCCFQQENFIALLSSSDTSFLSPLPISEEGSVRYVLLADEYSRVTVGNTHTLCILRKAISKRSQMNAYFPWPKNGLFAKSGCV